jgi:hypothetical protein
MAKKDKSAAAAAAAADGEREARKRSGAKRGRKGAPSDAGSDGASVGGHPRARSSIRRAKGWGGLGCFALGALLSLKSSVPPLQAGERALVAGIAGYLVVWWIGIMVWRHIIIAEAHAAVARLDERRRGAGEGRLADSAEQHSTDTQPSAG